MFVTKDQKNEGVIFGGGWDDTSFSGSYASNWGGRLSLSVSDVSARLVSRHLDLGTLLEMSR